MNSARITPSQMKRSRPSSPLWTIYCSTCLRDSYFKRKASAYWRRHLRDTLFKGLLSQSWYSTSKTSLRLQTSRWRHSSDISLYMSSHSSPGENWFSEVNPF
jgi:hypothetical protein